MNFLSLEYFLIIAKEGSISAAARRLLVSQQSLSEHVKKLENEVGAVLLKRGHTISLTPAGERFAAGAQQIVTARNDMLRDIEVMTDRVHQKFTVAVATFQPPAFMVELLAEFNARYPHYEVAVIKRRPRDIVHNMKGVDLYFSYLPLNERLENVSIMDDDYYCVCARRSLFMQTYGNAWPEVEEQLLQTGSLAILQTLPFLMLDDRQGMLAEHQELLFREAGFSPVMAFRSDSGDLNDAMCMKGLGANIMTLDSVWRRYKAALDEPDDPMIFFPIQTPGIRVAHCISYQKGKTLSMAEKRFIAVTREVLARKRTD